MQETFPLPDARVSRRLVIWAAGAALAASLVGYQNVLDAYFVSDDFPNLILSYDLQTTVDRLVESSTGTSPNKSYRPLINWTWYLDFRLWGPNPIGFHLQSLLWHAAASTLLALLVFGLTGRFGAGVIASLLFAIHPIHPEAVTWISARGDLIVAVFALASLLLLHAYTQRGGVWRLWLAAGSSLLAMLSKESAFSIPFMLLAYVAIYHGALASRAGFLRALRWGAPFVVATGLYVGARTLAIGFYFSSYSSWEPEYHLLWIVRAFSRLVLPQNWSLYGETAHAVTNAVLLLSLSGPILAVALGRVKVWRTKAALFMLCLMAASLVPIYDIFQSTNDLQGTRYWYLVTLGSCGLLAMVFDEALRRRGPARVIVAACVLVFVGMNTMVLRRNNEPWAEAGALVRDLVAKVDAGDPVRQRLITRGGFDTIDGAYVLRNGFDRAIRKPFAERDYYIFGRTRDMSLDQPPIWLDSIHEVGPREAPDGSQVFPALLVGKRSPEFRNDLLDRIEAGEISVADAAVQHKLGVPEIRRWRRQRRRAQ